MSEVDWDKLGYEWGIREMKDKTFGGETLKESQFRWNDNTSAGGSINWLLSHSVHCPHTMSFLKAGNSNLT